MSHSASPSTSLAPPSPPYRPLAELLERIPGPNGAAVRALYAAHAALFRAAPGSRAAHQAWPGGYLDHVTECLNLGALLYAQLGACRPLPFALGDVLLVLALHDVEKPARHAGTDPRAAGGKADRAAFREALLAEWGIALTPAQANALRYAEGEGDDYLPGRRIAGPLAALVHAVDMLSARLWFDAPAPAADPWPGAARSAPAATGAGDPG